MAKIYQLMIGMRSINDVYYDEEDAIVNATQIAEDTGGTVTIWEAEEIEGAPQYMLEWSRIGALGTHGSGHLAL